MRKRALRSCSFELISYEDEEIIQQTFVKAVIRRTEIGRDGNFGTNLRKVAHLRCFDRVI